MLTLCTKLIVWYIHIYGIYVIGESVRNELCAYVQIIGYCSHQDRNSDTPAMSAWADKPSILLLWHPSCYCVSLALLSKVGTIRYVTIFSNPSVFLKAVRQVSIHLSVYLVARPPALYVVVHPKPESPFAAPQPHTRLLIVRVPLLSHPSLDLAAIIHCIIDITLSVLTYFIDWFPGLQGWKWNCWPVCSPWVRNKQICTGIYRKSSVGFFFHKVVIFSGERLGALIFKLVLFMYLLWSFWESGMGQLGCFISWWTSWWWRLAG